MEFSKTASQNADYVPPSDPSFLICSPYPSPSLRFPFIDVATLKGAKGDLATTSKRWKVAVAVPNCVLKVHITPLVLFPFSFYCRGHMCHPRVMLMSLVPVPGTFLLSPLSDIPLAIVPCNEVAPHCTPCGGPPLSYSLQPQFLYHN